MAKKGVKVGPRIIVQWASVKRKVNGKTVTVSLTSQVLKSTATLFGLKESKSGGSSAVVKNITTKKGKRTVLSGGTKSVGTRKMYATVDNRVYHQLPVPAGLSLAKAYAVFKAGKKAAAIKFQGGTPRIIGKASKDTKSKSKASTEAAKGLK